MAAMKMVTKKKMVKRLTPAQAKMAAAAMKKKGKLPLMKAKVSAKFTPPGFDPESPAEDKTEGKEE